MELEIYKKLYRKYSNRPLSREVWDTPEYKEFLNAFHTIRECQIWELKKRIKQSGIDYKKYCCVDMAYRLVEDKRVKGKKDIINYDCVITYYRKENVCGIPIHDGGNSFIQINFCPWCGKKQPDPRREQTDESGESVAGG